jgi:hypothetical protein
MRHPIRGNGIRLFQPMFAQGLQSERTEFYESSYVRDRSYNHKAGVGAVFLETLNGEVRMIDAAERVSLIPKLTSNEKKHRLNVLIETIEWQNWLLDNAPRLDYLPPEQKARRRLQYAQARIFNEIMIKHHKNLVQRL